MRPAATLAAVAAALASACGGSSPTEAERTCRRYATAFTRNGEPYECTLEGTRFACSAYRSDSARVYASVTDFVLEAQIPNRLRVLREEGAWVGNWAWQGSGGSTTEYRYDGAGRLRGRTRSSYHTFGGESQTSELDAVEYRSWDAVGRPTSGVLTAGGESEPVTLWYDDAGRVMESSTGESVTRDADGNVVREEVVVGFGDALVFDYVIQGRAEVCLGP